MSILSTTVDQLREIRTQVGYGIFDNAVKILNRERLQNPKRVARIKWPKSLYQRLFDSQRGKCPYCPEPLFIPAKENAIDHVDPNAEGPKFNERSNLCLTHPKCNRTKSSTPLTTFAKRRGETVTDILERTGGEDDVP